MSTNVLRSIVCTINLTSYSSTNVTTCWNESSGYSTFRTAPKVVWSPYRSCIESWASVFLIKKVYLQVMKTENWEYAPATAIQVKIYKATGPLSWQAASKMKPSMPKKEEPATWNPLSPRLSASVPRTIMKIHATRMIQLSISSSVDARCLPIT